MTGTPRRSFLKGLFAGVVGGGAVSGLDPDWGKVQAGVVVRATPEEVQAFADPLELEQPIVADQLLEGPDADVFPGETLYNAAGQPVAVVSKLEQTMETMEITGPEDHWTQHVAGAMRLRIEAVGLRAPTWEGDKVRL